MVTHLFNQRLLKPEYMLRVLETLELDGARAAAVHMMASLYATWADMLKDEYNDRMGDQDAVAAGIMAEPAGGDYPFWLTALVQIVEAHGGQGFSETVPESMLSADTWAAVYGKRFSRSASPTFNILPQSAPNKRWIS